MDMKESKTPSETYTEQVHLVNQSDLNGSHRLFGGTLMSWIDITAGIVARRHAGMNITTVAVDNLHFIAPAYSGDLIVLCAKAAYAGNTSLEVRVDSYVEHMDGSRTLINTAHVVMVAIDENEKPYRIPRLVPETDEEIAEYKAGERRKKLRIERQADNY